MVKSGETVWGAANARSGKQPKIGLPAISNVAATRYEIGVAITCVGIENTYCNVLRCSILKQRRMRRESVVVHFIIFVLHPKQAAGRTI